MLSSPCRLCVLNRVRRSCLWSSLLLWCGSGMDSLCQLPLTLNTTGSCRRGSSNSEQLASHWPVFPTVAPLRASSSTYSKHSENKELEFVLFLCRKALPCLNKSVCVWFCDEEGRSCGVHVTTHLFVCLFSETFSCLAVSASPLQRVYPTWVCAAAASLLQKPSASWKICAGNSQHASIALLLPWQLDHIHFWSLVREKKHGHIFDNFSLLLS